MIDLHVSPQRSPKELSGHLLVVFENIDALLHGDTPPDESKTIVELSRTANLEQELQKTRESHQVTVEELESSNEELKSTNEELQSANEELQSTNEELEFSREELQSLNEELQTVNAEMQSKVEELSAAQDDMHNLLNGTEIATIFVDNGLRIRRFTRKATTIINLIQTDIGRPLQHVVTNLVYDRMITDLTDVLKDLTPKACEVRTGDGDWYNMRILPYRTMDNHIDGAVLTFAAIGAQKKAQATLDTSRRNMAQALELVRHAFDMNPEPIAVLDSQGRMVIANTKLSGLLGVAPNKVNNMYLLSVQPGTFDSIDLQSELNRGSERTENRLCYPYGAAQHCRYRQHIPRGLPRGGFKTALKIRQGFHHPPCRGKIA